MHLLITCSVWIFQIKDEICHHRWKKPELERRQMLFASRIEFWCQKCFFNFFSSSFWICFFLSLNSLCLMKVNHSRLRMSWIRGKWDNERITSLMRQDHLYKCVRTSVRPRREINPTLLGRWFLYSWPQKGHAPHPPNHSGLKSTLIDGGSTHSSPTASKRPPIKPTKYWSVRPYTRPWRTLSERPSVGRIVVRVPVLVHIYPATCFFSRIMSI